MPKGITDENFRKRSIARNPIIADLLRRTHYIEKVGTRIGRMKNLMKEAGLKEPQFKYDEFFEVTFLRASYYDENYGTYDLAQANKNDPVNLNKIELEILEEIRKNENITRAEIVSNLNLSDSTIKRGIAKLYNLKIYNFI